MASENRRLNQRSLRIIQKAPFAIAGAERHTELSAEGLKPKQLTQFRYRTRFVRAVANLPKSRIRFETAIGKTWEKMSVEERPERPPGFTSVYRWVEAVRLSGGDIRALLTNDARKGNRDPRFPDEVLEVCEQELADVYLTTERPTLTDVLNLCKARVRRLNTARPPGDQLPMPSCALLSTLLRRNYSEYDICAARYGPDVANERFRAVLHRRRTSAPLERGEIDHTRLDLMAIDDETGIPLGRPWLTLLIDVNTRCILGLCLSFEPPSFSTVAQCIRHAFMPKPPKFGRIVHEWEQFGVVSELVMDGGAEFYSLALEQVLLELDVEPHWAPRKTAWFKGIIERYNKTINKATTSAVPGKTFTNIFEREDYDPKKHAVMTLGAIIEVITKWICDVYHQKKHGTLKCAPAKKWKNDIRPHDIAVMADPDRVNALVGIPIERNLDHTGVVYLGLKYNNEALTELRRQLGANLKDVELRINRSDLGSVVVLHPVTNAAIRVECVEFEYADGLTEWQHNLCRKFAADQGWNADDPDAWLDALLDIHELVQEQTQRWGTKVRTGQRLGRWKEARAKKQAKNAGRTPVDDAQREQTRSALSSPRDRPPTVPAPSPRPTPAPSTDTSKAPRPQKTPGQTPGPAPVPAAMPPVSVSRVRFVPEILSEDSQ